MFDALCLGGSLIAAAVVWPLMAYSLAAPHESERSEDDRLERLFDGLEQPTKEHGWEW